MTLESRPTSPNCGRVSVWQPRCFLQRGTVLSDHHRTQRLFLLFRLGSSLIGNRLVFPADLLTGRSLISSHCLAQKHSTSSFRCGFLLRHRPSPACSCKTHTQWHTQGEKKAGSGEEEKGVIIEYWGRRWRASATARQVSWTRTHTHVQQQMNREQNYVDTSSRRLVFHYRFCSDAKTISVETLFKAESVKRAPQLEKQQLPPPESTFIIQPCDPASSQEDTTCTLFLYFP